VPLSAWRWGLLAELPHRARRAGSAVGEVAAGRGAGGRSRGSSAKRPFAFPTKFFFRIGAPIPISQRFGPRTATTIGKLPTEGEQSGAVYLTGDNVTA